MTWFNRRLCGIRFGLRYDLWYPILGRLQVAAARVLMAAGARLAETGVRMARAFDGLVFGGLRKRAYELGRRPGWHRHAGEVVEQARAREAAARGPGEVRPRMGTSFGAGVRRHEGIPGGRL